MDSSKPLRVFDTTWAYLTATSNPPKTSLDTPASPSSISEVTDSSDSSFKTAPSTPSTYRFVDDSSHSSRGSLTPSPVRSCVSDVITKTDHCQFDSPGTGSAASAFYRRRALSSPSRPSINAISRQIQRDIFAARGKTLDQSSVSSTSSSGRYSGLRRVPRYKAGHLRRNMRRDSFLPRTAYPFMARRPSLAQRAVTYPTINIPGFSLGDSEAVVSFNSPPSPTPSSSSLSTSPSQSHVSILISIDGVPSLTTGTSISSHAGLPLTQLQRAKTRALEQQQVVQTHQAPLDQEAATPLLGLVDQADHETTPHLSPAGAHSACPAQIHPRVPTSPPCSPTSIPCCPGPSLHLRAAIKKCRRSGIRSFSYARWLVRKVGRASNVQVDESQPVYGEMEKAKEAIEELEKVNEVQGERESSMSLDEEIEEAEGQVMSWNTPTGDEGFERARGGLVAREGNGRGKTPRRERQKRQECERLLGAWKVGNNTRGRIK